MLSTAGPYCVSHFQVLVNADPALQVPGAGALECKGRDDSSTVMAVTIYLLGREMACLAAC